MAHKACDICSNGIELYQRLGQIIDQFSIYTFIKIERDSSEDCTIQTTRIFYRF